MALKKKINVLMISSSSSLGGGTKHMFSLGENLNNNNFKIFYAMPKNKNFLKYLNKENFLEISERKLNLKDIFKLKEFIKLNSIDIIHAHGKGAGAISRVVRFLINKPLIYTFHGIHLRCHNWFKKLFYITYEYLTGWIDSKKIFVSNSEKIYAQDSKIYLGNNSLIINNGVSDMPLKEFIDIDKNNDIEFKFKSINVISVCRFVDQKNIKEILKIASRLPDLNFYIIGNGPLWQNINSLINKKNLKNISLLGEQKNIFKYLYASDIYLSTSLYEGLPLSILEAMSIGLPIVASKVIGNTDTIENGKSGFLYEINDIKGAVNFLKKLSGNIDLIRQISYEAHQRQRKIFSEKLMITNYSDLYMNLIM